MACLVTGGCGYTGTRLTEALLARTTHDVVVVNFLNRKNAADQRVFELLSEKFHLFEGVFGASDEVLGAIESGVDFEKRIAEIVAAVPDSMDVIGVGAGVVELD